MFTSKGKTAVIIIAFLAIVAALAALFVRMNGVETTKKATVFDYSVGVLSTRDGKTLIDDDEVKDTGLYMKDYITVEGLKIELEKDANIAYKVYYYGEKYQLLSVSDFYGDVENAVVEFDEEDIPETAKYARIQIYPTADKDGKVSWDEVYNYSGMLKVVYNK